METLNGEEQAKGKGAGASVDKRPPVDPTTLAHIVRPLEIEDFAKVDHEKSDERTLQLMRDYFHRYAAPVTDPNSPDHQVCPACGEKFTGLMANLGLGVGIEWGLVHGEGNCSYCRWPYRGHHFIWDPKDIDDEGRKKEGAEPLMTVHNFFLAYLPEHVTGWKRPPKRESLYE